MYRIEVSPAADRDLNKLKGRIDRRDFERLRGAVRGLAEEPRPSGVRKLKGFGQIYRVRVGDYRIVYDIHDDVLLVVLLHISRRSETTYR